MRMLDMSLNIDENEREACLSQSHFGRSESDCVTIPYDQIDIVIGWLEKAKTALENCPKNLI